MPINLKTQQDFRRIRNLPFCYICGKPLLDGEELDDDHVPPSGIFAEQDRNAPLILRVHKACNRRQSADDQVIAQLIGPIRGRVPSGGDRMLDIHRHTLVTGKETAILRGQELDRVVHRWLRGFHAALYGEPLLPDSRYMTILPFPETKHDDAIIQPDPIRAAYQPFLTTISEAQTAGQVDRIWSRNEKCRYECLWTQEDEGERWFCIYRLDLYNWSELGDINNFERRECVGAYIRPDRGAPLTATRVWRRTQTR